SFQAEDGIRDRNVTGVQTCALPISLYSYTKNNAFLKAVRRFWISSDTVEYQLSFLIRQIIWLIMIIGMIKATRFSFESNDFLLLDLLGVLAFLMIFEGGK